MMINKLESQISQYWESRSIYSKLKSLRAGAHKFLFLDGPPYTTGSIHLGTAWNKIIKDCILRYKRMRGYDVVDIPGWDMHGLPIEVKLEEELGFASKPQILEYGVEKFIQACKQFALRNMEIMTQQFKQLGIWMDWDSPYMTIQEEYIQTAWRIFKQIWDAGLVEYKLRIVNWCPRCSSSLADAEVEYEMLTHHSIYVKFPLKSDPNTKLVIWTTTPWTLVSNMGIAAHPKGIYAKLKLGEEYLILAEAAAREFRGEIIQIIPGEELAGLEYLHPLSDIIPYQSKISRRVHLADFVSMEHTGLVHISPAHGEQDFELGISQGLPLFNPVGDDGFFDSQAGKYAGLSIHDASDVIIQDLESRNALLAKGKISHRYGVCWRCKTPIIYLAKNQWFIAVSKIRSKLVEEASRVRWYPEWAGSARFRDWLEQARDWCISRQRFWGIPIPIWICERCGAKRVISSKSELESLSKIEIPELHLPYVDSAVFDCSCGGKFRRIPDVFDVWFDSAVASFAVYRDENLWPPHWIAEGHDQTRGWFYSQLAASVATGRKAPYRSVLMHGFVLDSQGRKMSKSLGNIITPQEVIEKFGVDAFRFYMLSCNLIWEDLRFNWKQLENCARFLNILWNCYQFCIPYMKLDEFNFSELDPNQIRDYLKPEDRWMISRLNLVISQVTQALESYDPYTGARILQEFVLEDLSHWYIPLVRSRTWMEQSDPEKLSAYYVLYLVLINIAKLLAPFSPFLAEKCYLEISKFGGESRESVHLEDWPLQDESLRDSKLESGMQMARQAVEMIRRLRSSAKIKLRWPLRICLIQPRDAEAKSMLMELEEVIRAQSNLKRVIILDPDEDWESAKKALSPQILESELEWGKICLDVELDRGLISEAYARELIRRIQQMRKHLKLELEQRIKVYLDMDSDLWELIKPWESHICSETRAIQLIKGGMPGMRSWRIEDRDIKIGIQYGE